MVTASQDGNASYVPAWPITLTENVAKATASVTFDAGTLSQTYDGTAKTVATTTLPGGLLVDLAFTGTPQAAGSYPVTATINDLNYTGSATGALTIDPARSAVTVSCPASATYTGAAIAPCTASYSGAGGLSGSLTPSYSNNVNVGAAGASATYAGDANHAGNSGAGGFAITAAPTGTGDNPLVNPGDQLSADGDEVELRIQVNGASLGAVKRGDDNDDNRRLGGLFSASGLPAELHIDGRGVIRGHIKKGAAGVYDHATVTYGRNGKTFSQRFTWTVVKGEPKKDSNDKDR
jgi:hypothetical protein